MENKPVAGVIFIHAFFQNHKHRLKVTLASGIQLKITFYYRIFHKKILKLLKVSQKMVDLVIICWFNVFDMNHHQDFSSAHFIKVKNDFKQPFKTAIKVMGYALLLKIK